MKAIYMKPALLRYQQIILYGSRARGDDKPGSDIDIALDMGEVIDRMQMINIISDLEDSDLPINFDLVDFNAVAADLQQQILKYGVVWKE